MYTYQPLCENTIKYLRGNMIVEDVAGVSVVYGNFNVKNILNNDQNTKTIITICDHIMLNIHKNIPINNFEDGVLKRLLINNENIRSTLYFKDNLYKYKYSHIQSVMLATQLANELANTNKVAKRIKI